jgi:hypothetical protein
MFKKTLVQNLTSLLEPLHLLIIFSRKVFCGATKPRCTPGIISKNLNLYLITNECDNNGNK